MKTTCVYAAFVAKTGKCPMTGRNCNGCLSFKETDCVVAGSDLMCVLDTGLSDHQKAFHDEEHVTSVIALSLETLQRLSEGESVYIYDDDGQTVKTVITLANSEEDKDQEPIMPEPIDPDDAIDDRYLLGVEEKKKTYSNEQLIKDKERIAQEKLTQTCVKSQEKTGEIHAEAKKDDEEKVDFQTTNSGCSDSQRGVVWEKPNVVVEELGEEGADTGFTPGSYESSNETKMID